MNDQLHCGHICAAVFLAFSGQLRTTGAEDFHEMGRDGDGGGGREREREREREIIMSAEDNALKTTFRELGLSKQRRKTEKIEISMYKGMIKYNIDSTPGYFLN